MADITLIKFPPVEPPKKEASDYYLARHLEQIAAHLDDLSTLLYEAQDQGKCEEIKNLIIGVESLLGHHANELHRTAENLHPGISDE